MQSYRIDVSGKLINFYGCEIGLCCWILSQKLWGKILINNKLKSKGWWENRKNSLMTNEIIKLPHSNLGIFDKNGNPIPDPIPYEVEFDMNNASDWFDVNFKKED